MKYISLDQAIDILDDSAAVIIMDSNQAVVYACPNDPDDDEFLCLKYDDSDGLEYSFHFERASNTKVRIEKSSMYLQDISHEEVELKILKPKNLEY